MKSNKWKKWLYFVLSILFLCWLLTPREDLFVIVKGGSMEPTLKNNQVVLASKNIRELFVGDIVVIQKNNELMIKRITAMQGAKYAENTSDEHSYILIPDWFDVKKHIAPGVKLILKEIPANYFFVEGDNADKSIDSKNFGLIVRNEIIGKCLYN